MVPPPRIVFLGAAALGFVALVVVMEVRTRGDEVEQMRYYGQTLAPLLWEVNEQTAHEYLDLILSTHALRALRVDHENGESFVQVSSDEKPHAVERALRAAGLIRDQRREQPITYREIAIGRLSCTWTNRNVYAYLGFLGLVAIGYAVFALLDASRSARRAREMAERALSESKVRLQTVVSGAPVILFALDQEGVFTLSEGKGLEKLGIKPGDLVGHSIRAVESISPGSEEDFRRALAGETFFSTRASGEFVFESWHSPLRNPEGAVSGVIGVSTDITDLQRAMHALEERDRKVRHEMGLARSIHRTLMPSELPALPGFQFGMLFVPSGDIGGDFVDFVPFRDEDRIGVVFADITGHGVPAALLSAMFKVLIDEVIHRDGVLSPASSIAELNRRVGKEFPPCNFASTFYLVVEGVRNRLTYVNAAQEPGLLIHGDRSVTLLENGGPALGIIPADDELLSGYEEGAAELQPGDMVFLYTDGLVEIEDESGEMLGRERLIEWLRDDPATDPQTLIDHIYARVLEYARAGELQDDLAVVVVRAMGT